MLLHRSEAERARSEASFQVASRSLDEITGVLCDELMNDPLKHERPNSKRTLEIVRALEIGLSKRYPVDIGGVKRLATISVLLAHFYSRDGKQDEARSLIQEAIKHCEAYLAVGPGDADIRHRFFQLLACMLSDLARSDKDRLYEECNAQAIALLERLKAVPHVHVADLCQLSSYHQVRADYLLSNGQADHARKVLEQDLALVQSMPAAERASSESNLAQASTLAALGRVLSRDAQQDRACSLIQEAIDHCEAYLAVSPGDTNLQRRLVEFNARLLWDLAGSQNDSLYEQCDARALALLERLKSAKHIYVTARLILSRCHRFARMTWCCAVRWITRGSSLNRNSSSSDPRPVPSPCFASSS